MPSFWKYVSKAFVPNSSSTTSLATGADEGGGSIVAVGIAVVGGLSSLVTVAGTATVGKIAGEDDETLVVGGSAKLIFIYYSHKNGVYYPILSSNYE
jgi:hypothetical protein